MSRLLSPSPRSGWAWFDFANSSYVLIFQTFLLPVYFTQVLGGAGQLASWGFIAGASTAMGAILAIGLGKYTDKHNRLAMFWWLIRMAFVGMVAVAWGVAFAPSWVPGIYLLTNTLFIASLSLSDSFLPFLARHREKSFKTSGRAWGFGYLGGIAAMVSVLAIQHYAGEFSPWAFISVAGFFIAFAALACRGLAKIDWRQPITQPAAEDQMAAHISPRQRGVILLGAWMIAECVAIAILFFSIYANTELGLGAQEIGTTLLLVQLVAFPATWLGGRLVHKLPGVWLLGATIPIWFSAIALLLFWVEGWIELMVVAMLCGLVLGNTQSFLRALYSNITPRAKAGYHFGFYIFTTQAAAFLGLWVYGTLSEMLGSQQLPMALMAVVMVVGFGLIAAAYRK